MIQYDSIDSETFSRLDEALSVMYDQMQYPGHIIIRNKSAFIQIKHIDKILDFNFADAMVDWFHLFIASRPQEVGYA